MSGLDNDSASVSGNAASGNAASGNAASGDAASLAQRELLPLEKWRQQFIEGSEAPAVPAATVVVLRDSATGPEALMLHRNSRLAFGGMWVFPGGRIDDEDYDSTGDLLVAARTAAVRETQEEASLVLDRERLVHFSYWVPPAAAPKRFATWFFAASAPDDRVRVDEAEIIHHEWMTPSEALRRCAAGEIELIAPTWVTLHNLCGFATVDEVLTTLSQQQPRDYFTRLADGDHGPICMWHGDAGYESGDASLPGLRHRLEVTPNGYHFDNSGCH